MLDTELLRRWYVEELGGDIFTESTEVRLDPDTGIGYLFDPNGTGQLGLYCGPEGGSLAVKISASPLESAPEMHEKVRTAGFLDELMLHFYHSWDSFNQQYVAFDKDPA